MIMNGLIVNETAEGLSKKKLESKNIIKNIRAPEEGKKHEDNFGGEFMNEIRYEIQLDPVDSYYHRGTYVLYSDISKEDAKFAVMLDTKLTPSKQMTLSVPNMKYLEEKRGDKAVKMTASRSYQKYVNHTEYIVLFNLYMVYRKYNALNLFFYYFLSNSFVSAKMIPMFDSEDLKEELAKEVKSLDLMKSLNQPNKEDMRKTQAKVNRLEHLYKETKVIENFADFYADLRDVINDSEELQRIGCFNHVDCIESEGVRPLIVPIKKNRLIDFDVMLAFLESLQERFNGILNKPHRLMLLMTDDIKPLEFETKEFLDSFYNTMPLLVRITEKCWIKDMLFNRFQTELDIK